MPLQAAGSVCTVTMPITRVRGVDVDFPHKPYDCQLVYMERVIEALQTRCNALLESPTGTGKVGGRVCDACRGLVPVHRAGSSRVDVASAHACPVFARARRFASSVRLWRGSNRKL